MIYSSKRFAAWIDGAAARYKSASKLWRLLAFLPVTAACVNLSEHGELVEEVTEDIASRCDHIAEGMMTFGYAIPKENWRVAIRNDAANRGGDAFIVHSAHDESNRIEYAVYDCSGKNEGNAQVASSNMVSLEPEFVRLVGKDVLPDQYAVIIGYFIGIEGKTLFGSENTRRSGVRIERVDDEKLSSKDFWKGIIVDGDEFYTIHNRYVTNQGADTGLVDLTAYLEPGGRYRVDAFVDSMDLKNALRPIVHFWITDVKTETVIAGDQPPNYKKILEMQAKTEQEARSRAKEVQDSDPLISQFNDVLVAQ